MQSYSNLDQMEDRMKRQAALYMLIKLVDDNNGSIIINSVDLRRAFNDENQVVNVEKTDGTIALAADMDGSVLDTAVRKWLNDNNRTNNMMT